MRIPENPCMLLPKALKMRAIKHTMALITDSSGRTKCAPAQMPWHLRHLNPALLNRQGMSTHPKMENGSELWKEYGQVEKSTGGRGCVCRTSLVNCCHPDTHQSHNCNVARAESMALILGVELVTPSQQSYSANSICSVKGDCSVFKHLVRRIRRHGFCEED